MCGIYVHKSFANSIPRGIKPDLKDFFDRIFITSEKCRPSAADCLKLDFLHTYLIPDTISFAPEIFSNPYNVEEQLKDDSSPIMDGNYEDSLQIRYHSFNKC